MGRFRDSLRGLFGKRELGPNRVLFVNEPDGNAEFDFSTNRIYTTKYTWYTFLPRGLFEQFRRVANLYFLFHAIVSLTPLSPVSPIATVPPLIFVVGLAMLKELWEDIKRGRSDYETNKRKVVILQPDGTEVTRRWRDVRVGELVRVPHDGFLPADLICVATSGDGGACYVETMNLDGETNLKMRSAVFETHAMNAAELARLRGRVECEHPNASIYTFAGKMLLRTSSEGAICGTEASGASEADSAAGDSAQPIFVTPANILLRGTRLRNTKWAVGLVVYTGRETKIMMNATDPPSKRSFVEKRLDFVIIFELVVLVGLAAFSAVMFGVYLGNYMPQQWYLHPAPFNAENSGSTVSSVTIAMYNWQNPALAGFVQFFTAMVLYGYFVPISLYVTMELVKLVQAATIALDLHMYYEEKDIPAAARTSNINEELGMVHTVLSDKTGTLTRNQMDFFKCSIAGIAYGTGVTEVEKAAAERAGLPIPDEDEELEGEEGVFTPLKPLEKGYNMKDPRLDDLKWRAQPTAAEIRRFLEILAVCHTVVADTGDAKTEGGGGGGSAEGSTPSSGTVLGGGVVGGEVGGGMGGGMGGDDFDAVMHIGDGDSSSSDDDEYYAAITRDDGGMSSVGGSMRSFHTADGRSAAASSSFRSFPEDGQDSLPPPSGATETGADAIDPDSVRFMAESPDEAAFVVAAKRMGMLFVGREGREVRVREFAEGWVEEGERRYTLLNTLEFTSHRKRMSVVVRTPEGNLVLLCKGADNIVMERLGGSELAQRHRPITEQHMRTYAEAGLRTLALAWREVGEEEYASWQARWEQAKANVADAAEQAAELEALADEMERGFTLLGATAIEDKLQIGVPQAIEAMAAAGIRLWVLTGDKLETAVNIGFACRLLRHGMQQHVVALEDNDRLALEAAAAGMDAEQYTTNAIHSQILIAKSAAAAPTTPLSDPHALIIDGRALSHVLSSPPLRSLFLQAALECASVICCRVSPMQKAQVTELVGKEGGMITLGIGDGANDVGMIQKAHIGVGIAGEEGQQAVMAADFSIGQFRFIERLLLVHGAWSYRRITYMIKYFLYKCHTFAFTIFFFNALALFSGSPVYFDWLLALFQVLFSALPVAVVGAFDQDVKAIYHIRYPKLYAESQHNRLFNPWAIGMAMGKGLVQACLLFALSFLPFLLSASAADGRILDLTAQGSLLFTALVLAVNLELALTIQYWTLLHHLAIWGSILLWFVFLAVVSYLPPNITSTFYGMAPMLLSRPVYYLTSLLATVAALLPNFAAASITRHLAPTDVEVIQEVQQRDRKKRLTRLATMKSSSRRR